MVILALIENHWLAVGLAAIVATSCVALACMVRNCPTLDDY
jgi:hypothetical protein